MPLAQAMLRWPYNRQSAMATFDICGEAWFGHCPTRVEEQLIVPVAPKAPPACLSVCLRLVGRVPYHCQGSAWKNRSPPPMGMATASAQSGAARPALKSGSDSSSTQIAGSPQANLGEIGFNAKRVRVLFERAKELHAVSKEVGSVLKGGRLRFRPTMSRPSRFCRRAR